MLLRDTTKDTLDLLASLIPHIENIVKHEKITSLIIDQLDVEKDDENFKHKAYEFMINKFLTLLPVLLIDLREDILMIVAKVNDTCIVDIENQHPLVTMTQIRELLSDKELMGFVEQLIS